MSERERLLREQWNRIAVKLGPRYADPDPTAPQPCNLKNYQAKTPAQTLIVGAVKAYCREMVDRISKGQSVVLHGPVGTGKDHLLAAMMWAATNHGQSLIWRNGEDIWSDFRDGMTNGESESAIDAKLTAPAVLAISDPIPQWGALSQHQARTLFRILDRRYRDGKATWVTLNVSTGTEAREAMGAAVVDRLRDKGLSLHCNWESFRKPAPVG